MAFFLCLDGNQVPVHYSAIGGEVDKRKENGKQDRKIESAFVRVWT
jgi:hypothetical protein